MTEEKARRIITRNDSPDIGFDRSINPYRGCEHGCVYCFARPTHAYLGLSAGLDFETKLFVKPDAAALLERELSAPGYEPRTIALGTNTDPYQPIERELRITREHPRGAGALQPSGRHRHQIGAGHARHRHSGAMANKGLAKVAISVTTLDRELARTMEPRASTPARRLEAIRALAEAGIPVGVMVAPIIPALNDHEMERILDARRRRRRERGRLRDAAPAARDEGAVPEWLLRHYPGPLPPVLSLRAQMRGGKDYDADLGQAADAATAPMPGMIGRRFEIAAPASASTAAPRSCAPTCSRRRCGDGSLFCPIFSASFVAPGKRPWPRDPGPSACGHA